MKRQPSKATARPNFTFPTIPSIPLPFTNHYKLLVEWTAETIARSIENQQFSCVTAAERIRGAVLDMMLSHLMLKEGGHDFRTEDKDIPGSQW